MLNKNNIRSLDHTTFIKFRRLYLLALLLIAISIIMAQILIQNHLNSQLDDSRIVNIAGRQRMLSQKLVKGVLLLERSDSKSEIEEVLSAFDQDLDKFSKTHEDLQKDLIGSGKTDLKETQIPSMFKEIESDQKQFILLLKKAQEHYKGGQDQNEAHSYELKEILDIEKRFLLKMDGIVNEYDAISQQKVRDLKRKEYLILGLSLLILILEIIFLFRPISIYIKNVIKDLVQAEDDLKEEVVKVNELYLAKEHSLEELQGLNFAINNAALFANLNEDGSVLHMSKKFGKLIGMDINPEGMAIDDLLENIENGTSTIKELIKNQRHSIWTGEINVKTPNGNVIWLEMSLVPMNQVKKNKSVLILCTDITKRIESQKELVILGEQKLKREVGQQKAQASQIVDAQEEERKRIAKDIHDGIGQMLTALKFNIESINFKDKASFEERVEKLKLLLSDLIKEVRSVTFNLTPPELKDYGIVPTLNKLVAQLSKLTGKRIFFENQTDFSGRFDSLVETNLYRVVQEALNNSLKYAEANYILITLSHSENKLSIVIDDDGKGFDPKQIENTEKDSGLGLFFMRERISYINGRIFINSAKGKGTRITINIDIAGS